MLKQCSVLTKGITWAQQLKSLDDHWIQGQSLYEQISRHCLVQVRKRAFNDVIGGLMMSNHTNDVMMGLGTTIQKF